MAAPKNPKTPTSVASMNEPIQGHHWVMHHLVEASYQARKGNQDAVNHHLGVAHGHANLHMDRLKQAGQHDEAKNYLEHLNKHTQRVKTTLYNAMAAQGQEKKIPQPFRGIMRRKGKLPPVKKHESEAPGKPPQSGQSAGYEPKDFDAKELELGAQHEMEHTADPEKARRIAMDHLVEDPKYYSKMVKSEASEAAEDFTTRLQRARQVLKKIRE